MIYALIMSTSDAGNLTELTEPEFRALRKRAEATPTTFVIRLTAQQAWEWVRRGGAHATALRRTPNGRLYRLREPA